MRDPSFSVSVNFQDGTAPVVAGYVVDNFQGYGARGNGFSYGWVTEASVLDANASAATPINSVGYPAEAISVRSGGVFATYDPRLTGYAHFDLPSYPAGAGARVAWELSVPNGWYEVTAAVGDTGGPNDSVNKLYIEGALSSDYTPTNAFKTELVTTLVQVTDGFLTLSAQGGTRTELQYLVVEGQLEDPTPVDGSPPAADYPSFIDARAVAQNGNEVFEVALAPASGFPAGVDPEADLFLGVAVAPGRSGIALESLSDGSIRLFETLTGVEVPISANTTAGADSVTISPGSMLKPFTSYTLLVDGAQDRGPIGDDQAETRDFLKFSSTFVTGAARGSETTGAGFTDTVQINGPADGGFGFTSVEISPDGTKLYVATITGEIKSWDLDPATGAIDKLSLETFAPGGDFNVGDFGRRGIIGLTFDPVDPDTIWITDNYPIPLDGRDDGVPEFSGRISKVVLGPNGGLATATVTPYVTGLPRSNGDHVTNSLEFRANPDYDAATNPSVPPYLLYVLQGSNSAMGAEDDAWGLRPERLLTAAVLEIDPTRTPPSGGFDVSTEPLPTDGLNRRFADTDNQLKNGGILIDSGVYTGNFLHFDAAGVASVRTGGLASSALVREFYDPFESDAVLKIFATGQRNAYDLVWHSNGSLYVPTNGSAAGGNVPDDPSTPADEARQGVSLQPDYLFKAEEGGYYGHPNALRDEFVMNGGNPTAGADPNQVTEYATGTQPDPNYRLGDAYGLGESRSPNGAIEYTSDRLGASLRNALLFVEYSGGNDVRAVKFNAAGDVVDDFVLRDFAGDVIRYVDPLDIVENPDTGQLYLITLRRDTGASQVVLLDPTPPPLRVEAEDFSLQAGFTIASNTAASGGQFIQSSGPSTTARAEYAFEGPSGVYTLSIGHFDENDGQASMTVLVNGVAVKAFVWDKQLGSGLANATTRTQESFANVELEPGDVISLAGRSTSGEPLRTDYLDISFVSLPNPAEAAPRNMAPASASTTVGVPFAFSGPNLLTVSDADGDALTVVLTVDAGALSIASGGGADVISYAPNSITVSGAAAQVNAALAGLVYTPGIGPGGGATLTIQTSDGSRVDTDTVAISVQGMGNPNADIAVRSLDPAFLDDRLHFSYIDEPIYGGDDTPNNPALLFKNSATVRVSSTGTEPLSFAGFELTGPFTLANPNAFNGLILQPGQFVDVQVLFNRSAFTARSNNVSSVFSGELRIRTNDQEDNLVVVDLAGNWQRRDEGSWEPNINEIWETFGFGNRIPGLPFVDNLPSPLNNFGIYEAFDQNEVLSPYWQIANGFAAAKVTHLAQYAGRGSAELGIHRPFAKGTEAVQLVSPTGNSQRILPLTGTGSSTFVGTGGAIERPYSSATFTTTTIPNTWQGPDVFGIHLANFSTDPTLNNIGAPPSGLPPGTVLGHWMRMFQALDAEGVAIPNVYLGIQDFSGSNGDYNDNVLVIEGVAPASLAPVNAAPAAVTLQENSGVTFTGGNLITVSDPNGVEMTPTLTTRLNVANGVLAIGAGGGATVTGNGTGAVTISGTIAQVNAALSSLTYTPNAGFDGQDVLRISSLDGVLTAVSQVAITVTPVDGPPSVISATVGNVTAAGGASATLTVVYADDTGVNVASIDAGDVTVTGPGGTALTVGGVTVSGGGDGTPRTATYTIAAPGGAWDLGDNGVYTVALKANEVRDIGGLAAAADASLAGFSVAIAPPATVRVEAESMSLQGFSVATAGGSSGGARIQANGSGEQRATHIFTGPAGVYNLRTFYWDENDGAAQLAIRVDGVLEDSFVWNQQLGSPLATTGTYTSRLTTAVNLQTGDQILLSGFQNAGESLRIDALDFIYVGPLVLSANPPVNTAPTALVLPAGGGFALTGANLISVADADGDPLSVALTAANGVLQIGAAGGATIAGNGTGALGLSGTIAQVNAALSSLAYAPNVGFSGQDTLGIVTSDGLRSDSDQVAITVTPVNGPPSVVSATVGNVTAAGGASATLTVVYADDTGVNVASIDAGDVTVTGPGGTTLTVGGVTVSGGGDGTPRTATYTIAAPGGAWDRGDNGAYTVALKANEVRDIGGLAAAAASLAGFSVAIAPPATVRVEAESMSLQGFSVATAGGSSGGARIQANGSGEQRATHIFTGPAGVYNLRTFYWDENDGAAQLAIRVDGVLEDSFVWNQQLGSPLATTGTYTSRLTTAVNLQTGDQILLSGFQNAGESLRIDALDFIYVEDLLL